jgi:hypothetical protein
MPFGIEFALLAASSPLRYKNMKKHHKRRLLIASETIRQLGVKELATDMLHIVAGASGGPCSKDPGNCTTDPQ